MVLSEGFPAGRLPWLRQRTRSASPLWRSNRSRTTSPPLTSTARSSPRSCASSSQRARPSRPSEQAAPVRARHHGRTSAGAFRRARVYQRSDRGLRGTVDRRRPGLLHQRCRRREGNGSHSSTCWTRPFRDDQFQPWGRLLRCRGGGYGQPVHPASGCGAEIWIPWPRRPRDGIRRLPVRPRPTPHLWADSPHEDGGRGRRHPARTTPDAAGRAGNGGRFGLRPWKRRRSHRRAPRLHRS